MDVYADLVEGIECWEDARGAQGVIYFWKDVRGTQGPSCFWKDRRRFARRGYIFLGGQKEQDIVGAGVAGGPVNGCERAERSGRSRWKDMEELEVERRGTGS